MSHKISTKRKLNKKANTEPTPEEQEDQIRLTAYYLWKEKGEKHGEDRDDWFEAESSFKEDYTD
ncbi:MAG: DUF2934 domain-containing protein [Chlorobium sp.]|jgi:Protein of unknown function (DUF2934)|nr:MAG: DUF2934 domain-containing protein [Chlorobium sp.]